MKTCSDAYKIDCRASPTLTREQTDIADAIDNNELMRDTQGLLRPLLDHL